MRRKTALFLTGLSLAWVVPVLGGWEAGAKIGFDTNVNRAANGEEGDGFLAGYAAFVREPSGEKRYGFTFSAALEGGLFLDFTDLSYAAATVTPGIVYFPRWWLTLSAAPFVRAKSVQDSDQSALALGGRIVLRERIRRNLFLGQHYQFTANEADAEAYSFTEHAVGISLGGNLSKTLYGEAGYEFARGDTFRTVATAGPSPGGFGMHRMFSGAFDSDVVREDVDRHTVSLSTEVALSPSAFVQAGYAFSAYDGELSSFTSHSGYAGAGYRF